MSLIPHDQSPPCARHTSFPSHKPKELRPLRNLATNSYRFQWTSYISSKVAPSSHLHSAPHRFLSPLPSSFIFAAKPTPHSGTHLHNEFDPPATHCPDVGSRSASARTTIPHACLPQIHCRVLSIIVLGLAGYCIDAVSGNYAEAAFLVFAVCTPPSPFPWSGRKLTDGWIVYLVMGGPPLHGLDAHVLPRLTQSMGRRRFGVRNDDLLVHNSSPPLLAHLLTVAGSRASSQ